MELIDGALLMRHEYLAGALVELRQSTKTASCPNGVLHHPPEAFDRIQVRAPVGGQQMELQLARVMGQRSGKFLCPMDTTAIDDHDHLFARVAEDVHDLMKILA